MVNLLWPTAWSTRSGSSRSRTGIERSRDCLLSSFRGDAQASSPGSITTYPDYGFRARHFVAPRNDERMCEDVNGRNRAYLLFPSIGVIATLLSSMPSMQLTF